MPTSTAELERLLGAVYIATAWDTEEAELERRIAEAVAQAGAVADEPLGRLIVDAARAWTQVRRDRAYDAAGIAVMERLRAAPAWPDLDEETRLRTLFHLGRSLWNNDISRMVDAVDVWDEYVAIAERRDELQRIVTGKGSRAWSLYFARSRADGFAAYAELLRDTDPRAAESELASALSSWRELAAREGNEAEQRHLDGLGPSVYAIHVALREELGASAAGPDGIPGTADDLQDNPLLAQAMAELDALVGLDQLKGEVRRLVSFLRLQRQRQGAGLPPARIANHMVFLGPPGTGKTTVARLMGRILFALGVLESDRVTEVARADLVGQYIGQTAPTVNEVVDRALGGVLFIDEAYSLFSASDRDYGREAVATLLKRMEDARERLVVIVAGYTKPMLELLASNPGLDSRFRHRFRFDAYDVEQLATIFTSACGASGYTLASDARPAVERACRDLVAAADGSFGNARAVRNLFESVVIAQASRLALRVPDPATLSVIEAADVLAATAAGSSARRGGPIDEERLAAVLAELDALVGIDAVKAAVRRLVDLLRITALRAEHGMPAQRSAPHMVFLGPPGTGKTTVARLMGRILHALGLLRTARVVEASRGDLVARYVGQTAEKTNDLVDRAMDGVLFIDEAYALVPPGGGGDDFGHEALATLIKRMEDDRDRIVVILAGYADQMEALLSANPGLPSRIGTTVRFDAYAAPELVAVFASMAERAGYRLDPAAAARVELVCRLIAGMGGTGGSAREVRRLLDQCVARQATRLGRDRTGARTPGPDELATLLRDDVVWDMLGDESTAPVVDGRRTAIHELGHALVSWVLPSAPAALYVTIRPSGDALGRAFLDVAGAHPSPGRRGMVERIAAALGGYVAEEVLLGAPSVGASSDLRKSVDWAREVVRSGLAEDDARQSLAAVVRAASGGSIDAEVEALIGEAYEAARTVVAGRRDVLDRAADELVAHLALDGTDLERLFGTRPAGGAG